jgi:hypothetical protein
MTHEWQQATIVEPGTPGARGGEPVAKLADGRTMPMGWNAGQRIPVGVKGRARYEPASYASLWRFVAD